MTTVPRDRVAGIIAQHEADEARLRARLRAVWPWIKDAAFILGCVAFVVIAAWWIEGKNMGSPTKARADVLGMALSRV